MQLDAKGRTIGSAVCAMMVAAVLTACSSSSTAPVTLSDAQVSTDLASAAAVAAATQAGDFSTQESQAGAESEMMEPFGQMMALGSKRAAVRSACTTGSFSGSLTFPAANPRDTISISRTWEFFAAGACENMYVAGTTDSIVFTTEVSAQLNGARGFWHTHHADNRMNWVTGHPALSRASTHVWSGIESGTDTSSFSRDVAESRQYAAASADTVGNVTFPHPRDGALYPASGTFTRWVSADVTFSGPTSGSKQVARHIVVTFNGSEIVPIVVYDVSTGAVALTCQLDLASGEIVSGSCTS
ncbi:MAG: hypothetical protein ACHQTF_07125 [Gemmatimonadales bacterium]